MTSQQRGPERIQGWPLRVIPLALLIILAMAGLRGAVSKPKWTGSHTADIATGIAVFAVFAVLLAVIMSRHRAALRASADGQLRDTADGQVRGTAARLRAAIMVVLAAAMAADVVAVVYGLHLKLPAPHRRSTPPAQAGIKPSSPKPSPRLSSSGFAFPIGDVLWGLLIVVLITVIVLTARWLARQQRMRDLDEDDVIAEDSADLREAVESGRSALRTFDDARAAIIACYVAMEQSLAERGAARAAADTPDELLARATGRNIVGGTAPARLTALFYEARFSSHPMDHARRAAAEQALDELAEALREAQQRQEAGA